MFALSYSPGAQDDIRQLKQKDAEAAALVLATVREIRDDQSLLDSLTIHDFEDLIPNLGVGYSVKKWWEHYRQNKNLWRLRVMDEKHILRGYRIIYAYSITDGKYYILGVVERSFGYDRNHPKTIRILGEYSELCT